MWVNVREKVKLLLAQTAYVQTFQSNSPDYLTIFKILSMKI